MKDVQNNSFTQILSITSSLSFRLHKPITVALVLNYLSGNSASFAPAQADPTKEREKRINYFDERQEN
jgi:hypothetical protein